MVTCTICGLLKTRPFSHIIAKIITKLCANNKYECNPRHKISHTRLQQTHSRLFYRRKLSLLRTFHAEFLQFFIFHLMLRVKKNVLRKNKPQHAKHFSLSVVDFHWYFSLPSLFCDTKRFFVRFFFG